MQYLLLAVCLCAVLFSEVSGEQFYEGKGEFTSKMTLFSAGCFG